jgi:hypothetical protein
VIALKVAGIKVPLANLSSDVPAASITRLVKVAAPSCKLADLAASVIAKLFEGRSRLEFWDPDWKF